MPGSEGVAGGGGRPAGNRGTRAVVSRPRRLVILSRSRTVASTRRLVAAAKARGYLARVYDPAACSLHVDGQASKLLHRGRRVGPADVVIPRIVPSSASHTLALTHHFELAGARAINGSAALEKSRNEMRSLQLLASHGVRVPKTVMGSDARSIKELVHLVGGVPVLVRLLQGSGRRAAMVCETLPSLEAALEVLLGLGQSLVVQRYVRAGERDVRALVVGGRVVCAVRRIPLPGRLERSARHEPIEIAPALAEAATKSARLMGLEVAAVDMLDEASGPKVYRVDGSPPLAALERATGLDLAGTIVDHAGSMQGERMRAVGI